MSLPSIDSIGIFQRSVVPWVNIKSVEHLIVWQINGIFFLKPGSKVQTFFLMDSCSTDLIFQESD